MVGREEEAAGLLDNNHEAQPRVSVDSISSASTTSLVFQQIDEQNKSLAKPSRLPGQNGSRPYSDHIEALSLDAEEEKQQDLENGVLISGKKSSRWCTKLVWIAGGIFVGAWTLATVIFLIQHPISDAPHNPSAPNIGNGNKVTLPQVLGGLWRAQRHGISWIEGANGEDGLLLQQDVSGKDYLVVEDVRGDNATTQSSALNSVTLMKTGDFTSGSESLRPSKVWPSKNLKHVLIATDVEKNWRHSFYARYWIFDVESQTAQPLDPTNLLGRVQLASWSPQSDAVVFTRDNNVFLRKLSSPTVIPITTDGNKDLFYGIPDWVYEEEVFSGNSATWWAEDGKYIAFLRTNESQVPEFPIQYFIKRPSGTKAAPGEENYPEVSQIKYPKAGAPNPIVNLMFYDVAKGVVFDVKTTDDFADDDRLITEVIWAGSTGKAIVKETNRESDILQVVMVDVLDRKVKTVRTVNVAELDGGWFEVSQKTRYIPADPSNGRPHDGYIDTIIHENYDHLGYFTPLDNDTPVLLTSGDWEVESAPSAVDLKKNLVYFVSTKESPIQRHLYSVKLDGTDLKALTDTSKEGYYSGSFSSGAGYALLGYDGPAIPWQRVVSTPSNPDSYEKIIEENKDLERMAKKHDLPENIYSNVTIDGFNLQVIERRPPHFDKKKKYPVLFHLYGGPGSQTVNKRFNVDFQAYVAANLGYIVVTVDGRGTGFIGREARCIIRGDLGHWEARDQIETAKIWAAKPYVDASRLAIWGWSYGGFMTLKTLEQDAGKTFQYGMAVAPVTDWRYYDSIYTERYMHTPQQNPGGYDNATVSDAAALQKNVRFLVMHGTADDNVHMQNTMALLDRLDLAGVENYDVHVFPDSDHGIYFNNANKIVYDKLSNWLINAFNGEWLRTGNAVPIAVEAAANREKE